MSATADAGKGLRNAPARGLLYMLAGVFCISVMDAAAKWLTAHYPFSQIIFIGRLPAPLFALAIALANGGVATLRTRRLGMHVARGAIGAGILVTFFLALRLLPLADTIAIAFVSPLFMSVLSVLLLGERVDGHRWAAIVLGFIGVLVIMQPSGTGFGLGAVFALCSALCYALFNILSRKLSGTEPSHTQLFWTGLVMVLGAGSLAPFQWVSPSSGDLIAIAAFALVGTLGQFLLIQAMRYAEVSLVASLEYSALIWATLFGFLFWSQLPTPTTIAGAVIIAASCLYIARREAAAAAYR